MIERTEQEILEFFGIDENSPFFFIMGTKDKQEMFNHQIRSSQYPVTDIVGIIEASKFELLVAFNKSSET